MIDAELNGWAHKYILKRCIYEQNVDGKEDMHKDKKINR